MKINLLSLQKEQEKQKKRISVSLITVSGIILAILGGVFFIVWGTNMYLKVRISSLDNKINETNNNIGKYSKIETKVNNLITGLDNIKQILDGRTNWEDLLTEIETFMPKESFLTGLTITKEDITFNVKTRSISKVVEFIESLRKHKFSINEKKDDNPTSVSVNNNTDEIDVAELNKDNLSSDDNDSNKVKLFNNIEISDYAKETKQIDSDNGGKEEVTYYSLEIKAKISEVLWSKNQN